MGHLPRLLPASAGGWGNVARVPGHSIPRARRHAGLRGSFPPHRRHRSCLPHPRAGPLPAPRLAGCAIKACFRICRPSCRQTARRPRAALRKSPRAARPRQAAMQPYSARATAATSWTGARRRAVESRWRPSGASRRGAPAAGAPDRPCFRRPFTRGTARLGRARPWRCALTAAWAMRYRRRARRTMRAGTRQS